MSENISMEIIMRMLLCIKEKNKNINIDKKIHMDGTKYKAKRSNIASI